MSRDVHDLAFFLNDQEMQSVGYATDQVKRPMPTIGKTPFRCLGAMVLFVALSSAQADSLDEQQTKLLRNFCAELKGESDEEKADFFAQNTSYCSWREHITSYY